MFILFREVFDRAFKHDWNKWLALFGVAWYGLHTANSETINYISARSELLSTALVIIALVSYIRSPFMRKYFLYLVPFVLGVLAKPPAFMFVPLLFIYLLFFEEDSCIPPTGRRAAGRAFLRSMVRCLPAVIAALMFLQITASQFASLEKEPVSYFNYLISQFFVALYYFKSFFLPIGLSVDYGWSSLNGVFHFTFLAGFIFVVSMLISAYLFYRQKKYRPIAFGILWFFIALIPTSFIPLTELLNDHRMFFPFVGLMMAVCWLVGLGLYKYEEKLKTIPILKVIIISIGIIILLANALGTYSRNRVWKDEESLWHDVILKNAENSRGLMNYGLTQWNKGRLDVALKYFLAAKKRAPNYAYACINLGTLYGALNNSREAEANYKQALMCGKNFNGSYYYYARWLVGQGRQDEAIPLLIKSIELSPPFLSDRQLLLTIYESQKKYDLATIIAQQILEIDPTDKNAWQYLIVHKSPLLNLGKAKPTPETCLAISLICHRQGKYRECILAAEEAIKLRPNYAEAYNNIGAAYNSMHQWDRAIAPLEKAIALKPDFQLAKNNLALAKSQKAKAGKP